MPDQLFKVWRRRWKLKSDEPIRSFCTWLAREVAEQLRPPAPPPGGNAGVADDVQLYLKTLIANYKLELLKLEIPGTDAKEIAHMRTEIQRLKNLHGKYYGNLPDE